MENNFEDKIKEVFNHPPEFSVDDAAWANISQRLEVPPVSNSRQPANWIWLPIALCMLGLASVAGYYFSQYQTVTAQLEKLEIQNHNTPLTETESIIEKHVTIIYDTIYKNISINKNPHIVITESDSKKSGVLYNKFSAPISFLKNIDSSRKTVNNIDGFIDEETNAIQRSWKQYQTKQPISLTTPIKESKTDYSLTQLNRENLEYVNSLSNNHLASLNDLDLLDIKFKNKKWKYRLQTMQPDRFALGLHVGIGNDFSLDYEESSQENYAIGLDAELGFGNRLSWVIGATYRIQNIELEQEDNEPFDLNGFPEILPQDPTDELEEIKAEIVSLEIPIGFKYSFLPARKIQPYLGFGFTSRKIIQSQAKFKFEEQGNQTGNNDDYEIIERDFLLTEFQWRNLWGNLGAQVRLHKQWRFFIEGKYQFSLPQEGTSKLEQTKLLNGHAGLKYQF